MELSRISNVIFLLLGIAAGVYGVLTHAQARDAMANTEVIAKYIQENVVPLKGRVDALEKPVAKK